MTATCPGCPRMHEVHPCFPGCDQSLRAPQPVARAHRERPHHHREPLRDIDAAAAAIKAAMQRGPQAHEIICTDCGQGINPIFGITAHYDCDSTPPE